MHFGRMASLAIAIAAVVGVFAYIPILSDYAFWILVVAYLVWHVAHRHPKHHFRYWIMVSLALLVVAIAGVFVEIPYVSDYAFWVLAAAYLVLVGTTKLLD